EESASKSSTACSTGCNSIRGQVETNSCSLARSTSRGAHTRTVLVTSYSLRRGLAMVGAGSRGASIFGLVETVTISSVGHREEPHQSNGSDQCTVHIRTPRRPQYVQRRSGARLS